jgi:hypothetical protein
MWAWPRPARVTVRVWRRVGGEPLGLFTFAGAVDAVMMGAIMEHVHRLTGALPGPWWIEVIAAGLDSGLVDEIRAALRALARGGMQTRLAVVPRVSGPRARRAGLALPLAAPPLVH